MYIPSFSIAALAGIGLAGLAAGAPTGIHSLSGNIKHNKPRQDSGSAKPQNVVYWGQNGGGTVEKEDLAAYCTSDSGIDVLVLSFLYGFGGGQTAASGTIGQSCSIDQSGQAQGCDALATAIGTCQQAGVKIIMSLGGATGTYSLSSQQEAEAIGDYLWEAYGKPSSGASSSVSRPFGQIFVNGFDFDIESNGGSSQYYQYMIAKLRARFQDDSSNTYYITGAPQCPIPEPNMGDIISASQFDYLFVQFYNNPGCSITAGAINYDDWTDFLAGTPSKNAKVFIGMPASPLGATGTASGEKYYAAPDKLASMVGEHKDKADFGGVMLWAAGFSDANVNNGCTFAQDAAHILKDGTPCGGGGAGSGSDSGSDSGSSSGSTPTDKPDQGPTSTAPASSPATTLPLKNGSSNEAVQHWGQCGGKGYDGPTQCASPFKCVVQSDWWASCH